MTKSQLVLIKGGKVDRPRASKKGGGKGGGRGKIRRPHPWNDLLWYVTTRYYKSYKTRAASVEEIAGRMTEKSKAILGYRVNVSAAAAAHCIYDCRRRHLAYGWMLLHVEKGAEGIHRGYIPVPVDLDEDDRVVYLFDAIDLQYVPHGLKSSLSSSASVLRNDADGILLFAAMLGAMGKDATLYEEFADDIRYLAKKAENVAVRAKKDLA